jgi:hypothetical protein
MRRSLLVPVAFALVVTACGDGGAVSEEDPAITGAPETTLGVANTDADATDTTDDAPVQGSSTEATEPSGPVAPDFTLPIGTGSEEFVLSAETRPVYLVFWAEW